MKKHIFIIDTSAILSGKPINLGDAIMMTTTTVSDELKPGGRDYRNFQFLIEKGLSIRDPSAKSRELIQKIAEESGDINRLSPADIDILALAYELTMKKDHQTIILTDDYSIQNVASLLDLLYQGYSQKGIRKKFKWTYQCPGCKKKFIKPLSICPICGNEIKLSISREQQ
jgi:UPF0271 protein